MKRTHQLLVCAFLSNICFADSGIHRLVDEIYAQLTPEERIAQICATSAGNLTGSDGRFSTEKARTRIPHGIGHVCQFACNRTDEPEALAQFVRDVQAFCMNETRAGIPAICHEEVISGLAARTATTYPQQIAVASSWDAPLLERKCRETSEAMRTVGATFALSPMADVIVNSNWTRLEEGYGESGYLVAVMGTAFVRGLQASGHAAACTKHFLGYGTIGGGEQRGWRDIFEEVVYPHEAMIKAGGAAAVMTSYDQFKGEQAVSNPTLIQGILRGYIGFDGTVVSDYSAVEWGVRRLNDGVEKTRLLKERAAAAIKAGNDVDLPQGAAYLLANVEAGGRGVGQALAVAVTSDRVIFRKCAFLGHQDTLLADGPHRGDGVSRQYYEDCEIEGTVDFIFGGATAVFNRCRLRFADRGYVTAASTRQGQRFGFVFVDCALSGKDGMKKSELGRPWRPYAQTVFIGCRFDDVLKPEGWSNWRKPENEKTAWYGEFGCTGTGAETTARPAWIHTGSLAEADKYFSERGAESWNDVLAGSDGWRPVE